MSILSTKGLQLFIGNAGVTPVAIAAGDMTAISNANPAVLSIASTTGMAQGDLIIIKGTGNKHIDGMVFVAGTIVADTSIVLTGLDLSAEAAPVDASTATGEVWGKTGMTTKVCASEISINSGQPGTVSIATFCNPTASVPSVVVEAGSITISGFIDTADAGYAELLALEEEAKPVPFMIQLPSGQGFMVTEMTISGGSYTVPIDGAVSFSVTGTMSQRLRHLW